MAGLKLALLNEIHRATKATFFHQSQLINPPFQPQVLNRKEERMLLEMKARYRFHLDYRLSLRKPSI